MELSEIQAILLPSYATMVGWPHPDRDVADDDAIGTVAVAADQCENPSGRLVEDRRVRGAEPQADREITDVQDWWQRHLGDIPASRQATWPRVAENLVQYPHAPLGRDVDGEVDARNVLRELE